MEVLLAILLAGVLPVAIVAVIIGLITGVLSRDTFNSLKSMSLPAQNILKEYRALPDSSRPALDILPALEAMDSRHDKSKLNKHFKDYVDGFFTWTECSSNNDFCVHTDKFRKFASIKPACPYQEYVTLHESIAGVQKELALQEQKTIEANTQVGYDMAKEINARLVQEREIIKSVTREFL